MKAFVPRLKNNWEVWEEENWCPSKWAQNTVGAAVLHKSTGLGTALPSQLCIVWLILKQSLGYQNDPSSFTLSSVSSPVCHPERCGNCDLKGMLELKNSQPSPDLLNVRDGGQDRERPVRNLNSAPCQENLSPAATATRLEGHSVTRWCWGTGACPWWINKQKTSRELSHFKHLFWVTAANCCGSINDLGCEKLTLHLKGCLQPEAWLHLQQCSTLHAGFNFMGGWWWTIRQELGREGVLWDLAARKTLAWEIIISCTSFLHVWPSCTASPRGTKLQSVRRAGISFSSTLIWLHWGNALIPILHHRIFQQKRETAGSAPGMNLPLAAQSPGAKRWNKS